jgi:menaquinone-dependent protoporphyrinogen oxidase
VEILIVYKSRHGTTQKVVNQLSQLINGHITLLNLGQKHPKPILSQYDMVLVGGSIHASIIQTDIRLFCKKHFNDLLSKPLGLFLCCMDAEKAQEQFDAAFYEEHRQAAIVVGILGGEFIFEKMNWFEQLVVRKIQKVNESISAIDYEAINLFASRINYLLSDISPNQ